jgi:DNA repair exonuclease SbcCD nuclease subunit
MEEAVNILLACGGTSETMPFDLKKIAGAGFDYCGLGGIRKPRHIVKNKMAYPGALEPMGCMDTGRRGFIYGEIENGTVRIKWEPFNYRSYVNLGFEVKEGYSAEKIESILTGQMEKMGSQNIYRILLSGEMGKGVKPDFSALKRAYNIYEILDQTYCGFNKDKLYLDNRSNLLGSFIESFDDKNDEISRKALEYGISAIWATGER